MKRLWSHVHVPLHLFSPLHRGGQWERACWTAAPSTDQECANQQPDSEAEVLLHLQDLPPSQSLPLQHLWQLRGWVRGWEVCVCVWVVCVCVCGNMYLVCVCVCCICCLCGWCVSMCVGMCNGVCFLFHTHIAKPHTNPAPQRWLHQIKTPFYGYAQCNLRSRSPLEVWRSEWCSLSAYL